MRMPTGNGNKNITPSGTKHGKQKSPTSRSNSISVHVCTMYAQSINEHPSVQFVLSKRIDIKHYFKMNIIQTSSYHIHHPIIIIGQCHIPNVSWCRHWHHTAAWSWLMRCFLGWPGRGVTPTKCSSAGMLRESLNSIYKCRIYNYSIYIFYYKIYNM